MAFENPIRQRQDDKDRWYDENVPLADKLYDTLLDELGKEGLIDGKEIR